MVVTRRSQKGGAWCSYPTDDVELASIGRAACGLKATVEAWR
jgi:hypothetical protein